MKSKASLFIKGYSSYRQEIKELITNEPILGKLFSGASGSSAPILIC
jgi:hypothetical protein